MQKPLVMSGGRYPVLRSLALLYLIGAGLSVLAGLVAIGYVLARANDVWVGKLILVAGVIAATFFVCLTLLAIAEVLKLFMDIEHNSRVTASAIGTALDGQAYTARSAPEMPHMNRVATLDEETAEGALVRGH